MLDLTSTATYPSRAGSTSYPSQVGRTVYVVELPCDLDPSAAIGQRVRINGRDGVIEGFDGVTPDGPLIAGMFVRLIIDSP